MQSLRQLIGAHGPLLVLDAASARVQVGWLPNADLTKAKWEAANEEAGTGVFRCIEKLGVDINAARAFAFCEGPGSVLGVRTVAMSIRSWQVIEQKPAFAYSSLELVAESLGQTGLTVIADARREMWHAVVRGGKLQRLAVSNLEGELATPAHFKNWSTLPTGVRTVPYDLPELFGNAFDSKLFRQVSEPDAFLHNEPIYAAWTPGVHRAPG